MADLTPDADWRKSSRSGGGECVEIAVIQEGRS
jgi:hypothetical protein